MTSETDPYREWDGAYVLGALGASERREFEQHLASCPRCTRAVGELAGMPGVLGLVAAQDVAGPDTLQGATEAGEGTGEHVVVPITHLARRVRTTRARRRLVALAAAVALVVAGVSAGALVVSQRDDGTGVVVAQAQEVRLEPVDGSGVEADLTLEPATWGTRLAWSCSYPSGRDVDGVEYDLTLVDAAGRRSTVATWAGDTTHAATGLTATTSLSPDQIARIELSVTGLAVPLAAATL